MHNEIKKLIQLFNPLFKRGIPFFQEEKGGMLSQKEYNDRLISCRVEHRQFDDTQHQFFLGKAVIDKLDGDFEMLFEFKAMCTKLLDFSYSENVELRVLEKEMINMDLPVFYQWKIIENYRKIKYKLHQ